jgi:hypothetical protein
MGRVLRAVVATAAAALMFGIGLRTEIRHHAKYGHWIGYGWHGDVISEVAENGEVPPGVHYVQRAVIINFTLLPRMVEACVEPNDVRPHEIPVYPFRIERLNKAGGGWEAWMPSRLPACVNLPIKSKVIWPLTSYSSVRAPVAAIAWFRKGDWIRFVGLSKVDKPDESWREAVSLPFQLQEERLKD